MLLVPAAFSDHLALSFPDVQPASPREPPGLLGPFGPTVPPAARRRWRQAVRTVRFFFSAWLVMIFTGIVWRDVGIRPFGYLTAMVVTIGLWLAIAPAAVPSHRWTEDRSRMMASTVPPTKSVAPPRGSVNERWVLDLAAGGRMVGSVTNLATLAATPRQPRSATDCPAMSSTETTDRFDAFRSVATCHCGR